MQSAEDFVRESKYPETAFIALIRARDAEWQARVDTLLEDNARSEEQVKKQFATAVGLKARAEKAEARVDELEAALEEIAKLDYTRVGTNGAVYDAVHIARAALGREA